MRGCKKDIIGDGNALSFLSLSFNLRQPRLFVLASPLGSLSLSPLMRAFMFSHCVREVSSVAGDVNECVKDFHQFRGRVKGGKQVDARL